MENGSMTTKNTNALLPFNVMGSDENVYDKDKRWWSTPYEFHNKFFTGFAHVTLSGVGCPDMGSLLTIATTGNLAENNNGNSAETDSADQNNGNRGGGNKRGEAG